MFTEILKSWWHNLREPSLYYYRGKEGREIDLLLEADGGWHPIEIKKTAQPHGSDMAVFSALKRLRLRVPHGGLVCLYPEILPLAPTALSIPAGCL